MFIKKSGDGCYYLYKKKSGGRFGVVRNVGSITNIFLIKHLKKGGILPMGINTPKELVGKRVMLQLLILKKVN